VNQKATERRAALRDLRSLLAIRRCDHGHGDWRCGCPRTIAPRLCTSWPRHHDPVVFGSFYRLLPTGPAIVGVTFYDDQLWSDNAPPHW